MLLCILFSLNILELFNPCVNGVAPSFFFFFLNYWLCYFAFYCEIALDLKRYKKSTEKYVLSTPTPLPASLCVSTLQNPKTINKTRILIPVQYMWKHMVHTQTSLAEWANEWINKWTNTFMRRPCTALTAVREELTYSKSLLSSG